MDVRVPTVLLASYALAGGASSATAPTAGRVIADALRSAQKSHKNVILDFGASWCPWCRKFEDLLDNSRFSAKFHDSYVIARITVREKPERSNLENPGWPAIMAKFRHAKDQDIPYLVILSPKGRFLGDSYEKKGARIPENAGYPQTPQEIDRYLNLLKRTSSTFSPNDIKLLRSFLNHSKDLKSSLIDDGAKVAVVH